MTTGTPQVESGFRVIGQRLPRQEDAELLTGSAKFVDDITRAGCLEAHFVRSVHAHAKVMSIDTAAALQVPSVVDIVTAADIPDVVIPMRRHSLPELEQFLQPPLAREIVRYVGEPIAVVVAYSRYVAEDAAELINVDYGPLEAVVQSDDAVTEGAPLLHQRPGTNLAASFAVGSDEIDDAFANAHIVVEERFRCHRHTSVPLETRGLVAEYDRHTERLTVWGVAKVVHANRQILAQMLGWPPERIRVIETHVGGGFGVRGEFYPEDFLIPYCAIRLERPVSWTEDRSEHFLATNHSREQIHEAAIALDADGRFMALRDRVTNDTGAYIRTHGVAVPTMTAAVLPGPYVWPAYRCDVRQVVTNKTPAGTYRAPGRYEANFVRERLIDIAARRLGRDPLDLRRQNLVPAEAIPYSNGSEISGKPVVYESGDYALLVEKACSAFDFDELCRWRAGEPASTALRRGVGVAMFVEKSGSGGWDYARVELDGTGRSTVYVGAASLGQGMLTVMAQICAEYLGVAYDDVCVCHGDTETVPEGMGAFGSRASMLTGSAVMQAASALRDRLADLIADAFAVDAGDVAITDGIVVISSFPEREIELGEALTIVRAADGGKKELVLQEESRFSCDELSFPYGLHFAAVEVDLETGGVRIERYAVAYDVGRAINPALVEGQIIGGVAQGIGGALLEELIYDAGGQLVTGSFMDYLIPTAHEVPRIDVLVTEDAPTPLNPLGVKGAGEGGTAAAGAALANAVSDALGAEVTELPLSPERLVQIANGTRA